MSGKVIKINVNNFGETELSWLLKLLNDEVDEAYGASENEHLFALGSDGESAVQHELYSDMHIAYARVIEDAADQVRRILGN